MVRETDSSSESGQSDHSTSDYEPNSNWTITESETSVMSSEVLSDEDEDPFKGWYDHCQCSVDYRGELDESHCPRCHRMVNCDFDNDEDDWSAIERNFKVVSRKNWLSKSLEDFIRSIGLWGSQSPDIELSNNHDTSDIGECTTLSDECYLADDEAEDK